MNIMQQPQTPSQPLETEPQYPAWLTQFVQVYQTLDKTNLVLIEQIYHQDIEFRDPVHQVVGLPLLGQYFAQLYQNLHFCQFSINEVIHHGNSAALYWQMRFAHPKLNNGKTITLDGHSKIKARNNKVIFHRDYFDMGAMLYQHIPLLGGLVRMVNKRLASN